MKSIGTIYQLNRNIKIPARMNTSREWTANWDESIFGNYIHVSVGANLYRITVGNNGRGITYPIQ